jgi:hypothetical protein
MPTRPGPSCLLLYALAPPPLSAESVARVSLQRFLAQRLSRTALIGMIDGGAQRRKGSEYRAASRPQLPTRAPLQARVDITSPTDITYKHQEPLSTPAAAASMHTSTGANGGSHWRIDRPRGEGGAAVTTAARHRMCGGAPGPAGFIFALVYTTSI